MPLPVPVRLHLDLDTRVLVYSVVLMFLASLAAGVLPAWQATRESLAVSGRRGGRLRLRRGLVVAQVAVAFVVLTTSVLFLRNLFEAGRISPGFDTLQTVRADVHLPSERYDDPQRSRAFVDSALQALEAAPGIRAGAAAYLVPLTDGANYRRPIIFADSGERVEVEVHWNAVSPRYFEVMAIPFVSGTTFAPREDSAATPVIVNREWTRRYSPQRPAVGRAFRHDGAATLYRVVGVVEGTKNRTLGEDPLPQLYEHLALKGVERSRVQLIAQVTGPPALAVPAVGAALRGVEPAAGVTVEPMAASMAFAMLPSQVGATMLGSLGLLGLGLAAVGLYGVIAYSVTRRTARDRHPHGRRCRSIEHRASRARRGRLAGRIGCGHRARRRAPAHASARSVPRARRQPRRSGQLCRGSAGAHADGAAGQRRAGPASHSCRADACAEGGVIARILTVVVPILIRSATAADLPVLGHLGALLMRVHHDFDAQRFLSPGTDPERGYAWFLGRQIEDKDCLVLVAELDGDVIGYVYAAIEPLSWKELRDECRLHPRPGRRACAS